MGIRQRSGTTAAPSRWAILAVVLVAACVASEREAVAGASDHSVRFINRCSEQIWLASFGPTSAAPPNDAWALAPICNAANAASLCAANQSCHMGSCTCSTDADCTFGSTADTTATCDATVTPNVCVRETSVSVPPGWDGRFWARTRCQGTDAAFSCKTGQCGEPTGNIDCTIENATANRATLFELNAADVGGSDNFDVSLASGYNVPIVVKTKISRDLRRKGDHHYDANEQIIEKVDGTEFAFSTSAAGVSAKHQRPVFPGTWGVQVNDGTITWTNNGPACATSGCKAGGIDETHCPSALQVMDGDDYVACDAPANVCIGTADCATDKAYYQCTNFDGATDLFGNLLVLQSPNAETPVCFSAADCQNGTTCQRDPEFVSGYRLTKGAGLCTPVIQNGGCSPGDDGLPCPARGFPFVDYQCETLANEASDAQVCVPPKTRGYGELWWNGANWTYAPTPSPTPAGTPSGTPSPTPVGTPSPTPTPAACTSDSDCASWQKCLTLPNPTPSPGVALGLKPCPPGDNSCTCWNPQRCTAATCPGANQCLNKEGIADGKMGVDCSNPATEPDGCYCSPQGVYSGTCGPSNAKWLRAARQLGTPGARWPWTFKDACPIAYSYQFDDPSSDWSCPNPDASLNDYVVTFCSDNGVPE